MEDLDRAYVINGDDLRIALAGMNGKWPSVANPRTMAGDIIDAIAQPLDKVAGRVTREQLARALEDFRLPVFYHGETLNGASVADADGVAQALYAALGRMAALREPDADVVEAHVCCEHADTDPELAAMAALLPAVPLLQRLGYDARVRLLEWYGRRVNDGQAPF